MSTTGHPSAFETPHRRALDQPIRPTRAEISIGALQNNLRVARRAAEGASVLAVVKANAYGHGAVQVARVLEAEGVALLGVALVEEGIELRRAGVRAPILVMGGSLEGGYALCVAHQLTPTVFRAEHLEAFSREAVRAGATLNVHVKMDTGMSRLGVLPGELPDFLALLRSTPGLAMEGFYSQLASADVEGASITQLQLALFREGLARVRAAGFAPRFRHLANTAGTLSIPALHQAAEINLVRPGLMLYGLVTSPWLPGQPELQRVMRWKTGIIHLKTVPPGTPVSYGGTWTATRPTRLATLPIGYADGYQRQFSSRAHVLIRGRRAPIVGRVTMDLCLADVTAIPDAAVHDEVVLLGPQGREEITAEELADLGETVHYEVLCGVGARVPRVLVP